MKRVLFISHRMPYPPDKGDRLRMFHEIVELAKHFRVTAAVLIHEKYDHEALPHLQEWCEKVIAAPAGGKSGLVRGLFSLLTGGSVTQGFFRSRRMRRLLLAEARQEPFDLIVAHCSGILRLALAIPAPRYVIDLADVDSAKWASYAEGSFWPSRWLYAREAHGVRRLEIDAVEQSHAVTVVSETEAKALPRRNEKVLVVSNGVDMKYFSPVERPVDERPGLVFVGQMDYRPNIDGVCSFAGDVWPVLRRSVPDLTFTIVGRKPARAVKRLEEAAGIRVTGSVPDVRPYLAAATVVVCPLKMARGIQNKVLEAMAMGRAVVASGAALEGLDVTAGEHVLQADTPRAWHEHILALLSDQEFRRNLEHSARTCVETNYRWETRLAPLVSLCKRLTESSSQTEVAAVQTKQSAGEV